MLDPALVGYALLIVLRLMVALFSPSYIHPDEYFQSVEITAHDIFQLDGRARIWPWEMTAESPIRSILPVYALTGLPFWLLAKWHGKQAVTGDQVFQCGRLAAFFLSLLFDLALWHLLRGSAKLASRAKVWQTMLLSASLWPVLVLYSRPTMNMLESVIVALVLSMTNAPPKIAMSAKSAFSVGFLSVFGFFGRPTIVAFLAPTLALYLYRLASAQLHHDDASRNRTWLLGLVLGGLLAGIACIVADTLYYGSRSGADSSVTMQPFQALGCSWIVAPLNFILYNQNSSNLASHGLHPRCTHVLVNMCLLFGPLYFLLLRALLQGRFSAQSGQTWRWSDVDVPVRLCASTVVFSLAILSLFPHQEPRFLLPLVFPLVYMVASHVRLSKKSVYLHLLFHSMLLVVFGLLHQGGLTPLIRELYHVVHSPASMPSTPTEILFYQTYMPPTHLLMLPQPSRSEEPDAPVTVTDLAGRLSEPELSSLLERKLRITPTRRLIVVVPGYVNDTSSRQLAWQPLAESWPHLSLDHLDALRRAPSLADALCLKAYTVTLR